MLNVILIRINTIIENPYNFITELGKMVDPELTDAEQEDLDVTDVVFNDLDKSWSFTEAGNASIAAPNLFTVSIPLSETLDELAFSCPLTPVNPSISPAPPTTFLQTPASTPSIVLTPSSPPPSTNSQELPSSKPSARRKDSLTDEFKNKCAE